MGSGLRVSGFGYAVGTVTSRSNMCRSTCQHGAIEICSRNGFHLWQNRTCSNVRLGEHFWSFSCTSH